MNEHTQTNQLDLLINLLFDDGLQNALPRIAEILMNTAMILERETHIGAAPYQRGVDLLSQKQPIWKGKAPDIRYPE